MTSIEQFKLYAKENLECDDHDLILSGDKFRNPNVQMEYLSWQESLNEDEPPAQSNHYHIPPV